MQAELRAIFFDLDDTLYCTTQFASLARFNAVQSMVKLGVRASAQDLYQELQEVVKEFTSNYHHHFNKLLLRLPQETHSHINPAILIAQAVIAYHQTKTEHLAPYPDAITLLEKLKKTNLIVGVITAGQEIKQAEKLLRLNIYPYLHPQGVFISEQVGISKPNPKLYEKACKTFGLRPQQTMYLGDHPEKDIDPAVALKMCAVRVLKEGKYRSTVGKEQAHFCIENFLELEAILLHNFGIQI